MRDDPNRKMGMRKLAPAIPGLFTFGNLVSGIFAILHTMGDSPLSAVWFIFLGAFLDALDGKVARMTKANTGIGIELDSLADFTTFGIAPIALLNSVGLFGLKDWRLAVGILYTVAGAYRLARYNVKTRDNRNEYFCGLPIPIAAVTIASALIFINDVWPPIEGRGVLGGIAVLAWLMISQVKYPKKLPALNLSKTVKIIFILPILIVILSLILFPSYLLYPLMMLYILFGLIREISMGLSKKDGDEDVDIQSESKCSEETHGS